MTKVKVEDYGWIYVVIVLDWYTKKLSRLLHRSCSVKAMNIIANNVKTLALTFKGRFQRPACTL